MRESRTFAERTKVLKSDEVFELDEEKLLNNSKVTAMRRYAENLAGI